MSNPVQCAKRADNFGITCVRAYPNDPPDWCDLCWERRNPAPLPPNQELAALLERLPKSSDGMRRLLPEPVLLQVVAALRGEDDVRRASA